MDLLEVCSISFSTPHQGLTQVHLAGITIFKAPSRNLCPVSIPQEIGSETDQLPDSPLAASEQPELPGHCTYQCSNVCDCKWLQIGAHALACSARVWHEDNIPW